METHALATIADSKAAASWGERKKTAKTQLEPAFGWLLIGWALGRSLKHIRSEDRKTREASIAALSSAMLGSISSCFV